MPIHINLLAEQQAAEESRRRDPIKRAIFGGSVLTLLVVAWMGITQLKVRAARSELATCNLRLKNLEESTKQARATQIAALDSESRLKALDHYTANRFFWGTFLDELQHSAVDHVRLTEILANQKYASADTAKFFTTNLTVSYTPPSASWKFWAGTKAATPIDVLVGNQLVAITNAPPFTTNTLPYTIKITETSTNAAANQVGTTVDFTKVAWASEKTVIQIRGRDYGSAPGAGIDEFARRLTTSPYFKALLDSSHALRFTERPPQPRPDPQDPANPNALFVPFTIELTLAERIYTNEKAL
jgi:hypothetical protein